MANHLFIKILISLVLISVEARPHNSFPGYEISFVKVPQKSPVLNEDYETFDQNDLALDLADCKKTNLPPELDDCVPGMEDMPQYQRSSKDNIVVMFDDAVMLGIPDCDKSKVPNKCPPPTTLGPSLGLLDPNAPPPKSDDSKDDQDDDD